ncbi:MAG: GTPase ObgE [Bacilli bacterium]|nr:GTPase ObgE [Bacilli bacterium]
MFIDEVIIKVKAGDGGDGSTSFRHEKYIEMGGPDGGNGGRGGNIIFEAEKGLKTLIDLKYQKTIKAEKGGNGSSNNKTGKTSEDLVIKVPIGTTIKDNDTGLIICDLIEDKERCVVAKGGRGGKGNSAFKTNKNKAPLTSEYGEPGEEKTLLCELKLLADVGLVGFPSVGKSSLISIISASKPKIADYHFTTLSPNLGVVKVDDYSFVVADLPGLIEGASEGIGLGDRFLKHAFRTKVICHIIDMSASEGRNPIEDYKIIRNELKKYSDKLYNKTEILVANKMDLQNSKENLELFKNEFPDLDIIPISAVKKENINTLLYKLKDILIKEEENKIYQDEEFEDYVLYEFKNNKPYSIRKENDIYIVEGEELHKLLKMTRFNSDEATLRFAKKLKNMGVEEELKKMGAKEGDIIKILDQEFEYEERFY